MVSEETDILGKRLKVYGGGCGLWHERMNAMITLEQNWLPVRVRPLVSHNPTVGSYIESAVTNYSPQLSSSPLAVSPLS